MRRQLTRMLLATVLAASSVSPVWAQDPIHKAGRGVVNVLTGWIEVPKQLHLGYQEPNPVSGLFWGLVKGVGMTVLRSGIGFYEVITFPIAYPKDYASPYDKLEVADYAWD